MPQRKWIWWFLCAALAAIGPTLDAAAAERRGLTVELRANESKDAAIVEEVELYAASHALVIGIDGYSGGWPRLSNAVKDAQLVAAALKERGFAVTLKTDLTSRQLKTALEEFFVIKGEDPEARLFVWFAGHGVTENGEGFIVPVDAPLPGAGATFRLKALSLRRFGEFVHLAQSKHAFAGFDSCFAGTIFDTARALPPVAVTRATTRPVRQFLTSGDAGQTVSDDGTFRELFLRALSGEERADANGDKFVTASEIGIFLADRITNLTQAKQTPRYGKLRDKNFDLGDFVFALRGDEAPPAPRRTTARAARTTVMNQETVFWQAASKDGTPAAYNAYLKRYPNGTFAPLARLQLREKTPPAAAAPKQLAKRAVPPPGAEVYRLAPVKRKGVPRAYLAAAIRRRLGALPGIWVDPVASADMTGAAVRVSGKVVRYERNDRVNPEFFAAELGRLLLGDAVRRVSKQLSEVVVEVEVTARTLASGETTAASAVARRTADLGETPESEVERELLGKAAAEAARRLVLRLKGETPPEDPAVLDFTLPGLLGKIIDSAPPQEEEEENSD